MCEATAHTKFCLGIVVSPSPSRDGWGTDRSAAGSPGSSRAAWSAAPCSRTAPAPRGCWGTCDHTTLATVRKVTSGKNLQADRNRWNVLSNKFIYKSTTLNAKHVLSTFITEWMSFEHDKAEVTAWWETDNEEFHSLFCLPNIINI